MSMVFPTKRSELVEGAMEIPRVDIERLQKTLQPSMKRTASKIEKEECSDGAPVKKTRAKKTEKPCVPEEACKLAINNGRVSCPSAVVLEKLKAAGDTEGLKTALAARAEFRKIMYREAKKVEAARQTQIKVANRVNARQQLVEGLELSEQVESNRQWRKAALETLKQTKTAKTSDDGFKKVSDMTPSERKSVVARLKELGFASDTASTYVDKVLAAPDTKSVPDYVVRLASISIGKEEKTNLLKDFIKTANLSAEQKSRVKDYWANELGYQDKTWIDDIVKDVDPVTGD